MLTDIEKSFVAGFIPGRKLNDRQTEYALEVMKSTAYHEAAHSVARAFTGLDFYEISSVSIIPNEFSLGRESSTKSFTELSFDAFGPKDRRSYGRMLLLGLLAGHAAEACLVRRVGLEHLCDDEEWNMEDSDLCRARRVAHFMAYPSMPAYRIWLLAESWTFEMLNLPPVWEAVEKVAEMLLKKGSINDINQIDRVCESIFGLGLKLPKWKRRLFPELRMTKSESELGSRQEKEDSKIEKSEPADASNQERDEVRIALLRLLSARYAKP